MVPVNASGFPRLNKDGRTIVTGHRTRRPCGLRAGDEVRGRNTGIGRRRRWGTATSVHHDRRWVVVTGKGEMNIMAKKLALTRRGMGAHIA